MLNKNISEVITNSYFSKGFLGHILYAFYVSSLSEWSPANPLPLYKTAGNIPVATTCQ